MASILESAWQYLITHFSDFQLACLGSFFLHESVFFLSGLPFIYLERLGYLSKYKIQTKNNTPAAQNKCITRLLLYHFGVNLPVMIFSYPVFRYMGMQSSLPLPSWKVILTQILFYFILEDFVFYWGHRILHTKWLYKHVHSIHHEYATPFGLTSEYAHPAEILFLGFATILGPAITGPHLFTLWLWMVVRVLETVEAHCGYHFPFSLSNFIPLYGGANFHDYHHRVLYTKSGNYSSTFVYMDWIFGTDKGYRKLQALKRYEAEASNNQTSREKSTTTTLTLSALSRAKANFVSSIDASKQALSELSPPAPIPAPVSGDTGGDGGACAFRHIRATPHAVSLDTTSHSPSLARIKHSSSGLRSHVVTSGSEITYGFK
ncbi:hypothetical protein VitviT2T_019295 [Vitis vinifera]|uniref:Fatty acid hydroxylase domain-containing protein n=2 Tax=Vitis vinifera TaxID=29760 RepID=A0ABY9D0S7_VITVI|nr:hypothetical protein VitviT2T_019295 [Vitis vinifera]